jgi:peptidoglycan/xylan/chitin deacetylase (PgdA/CDA1 family)
MNLFEKIYEKLSRNLVYSGREINAMLGRNESFITSARGSRIIIYHGVCKEDHTKFNSLFVTQKTFEAHLNFYRKYCNVISVDDFFQQKFSNGQFNVCLTFDDGFANNHKYVLPLLEAYQMPATFFITAIRNAGYNILWNDFLTISSVTAPRKLVFKKETFSKRKGKTYISAQTGKTLSETLRANGFEEKQQLMQLLEPYAFLGDEDYWLQMSIQQIQEAAASPFITVGSHGYYHNDFAQIPVPDMRWELQESKSFLENIIQKPVRQLAFPYGSYSPETLNEAVKVGYEQLLATEFLSTDDSNNNTLRERMGVNPYLSVNNQLHAILKGRYE